MTKKDYIDVFTCPYLWLTVISFNWFCETASNSEWDMAVPALMLSCFAFVVGLQKQIKEDKKS